MTDFITIFAGVLVAQIFATLLCFGVLLNNWVSSKITKIMWKNAVKNMKSIEEDISNLDKTEP